MQNVCHRCGRPIEGQLAFCSSCGAPQIRVSTASAPSAEVPEPASGDFPTSTDAPVPPPPSGLPIGAGIAWRTFFRSAAPLAVLTGMLTVVLPPLGLFIALPACLFWSISVYRRRLPVSLRPGQGGAMGALMALLSFTVFMFFFLAAIYFKTAEYRDFVLSRIHEIAARNPDPQSQQTLQWFSTPDGLIVFTAVCLGMILLAFLVVGMGSGALAVGLKNRQNRP
jgi:hypothetical protein